MVINLTSKLKYLLLFLFCSISYLAKSQDTYGTIQLNIYPDTIHVLIDSTMRVKGSAKVVLPVGKHKVLIQGKKLAPFSQTINIIKDSTIYIRKIMKYNDDYKKYQSEILKYNLKKNTTTISVAGLVLGVYYLSYTYTKSIINKEQESKILADHFADEYNNSQSEADLLIYRDNYRKYKKDYDDARILKFSMIPVVLITSYLGYKSYGIIKKINKPIYLEPLSFNIGYIPGRYANYSLTYKF